MLDGKRGVNLFHALRYCLGFIFLGTAEQLAGELSMEFQRRDMRTVSKFALSFSQVIK